MRVDRARMRERKRERKRERERELDDSEFKGANTIRNFDVGDERAIQKKKLSLILLEMSLTGSRRRPAWGLA